MITHEERNAIILRRTLSAVSWLYAIFNGFVGFHGIDQLAGRLMLGHAALLALAGTMLWRPRRGATLALLAAAAGSVGFVVLDLRRGSVPAAAVDGLYVLVAAALLYKSRRQS